MEPAEAEAGTDVGTDVGSTAGGVRDERLAPGDAFDDGWTGATCRRCPVDVVPLAVETCKVTGDTAAAPVTATAPSAAVTAVVCAVKVVASVAGAWPTRGSPLIQDSGPIASNSLRCGVVMNARTIAGSK